MYGTEPRFNEILLIITTNTIQNPNRKLFLGITNKCEHMIKKKAKQTNKDKIYAYSSFKQFCLPALEFLVPLLGLPVITVIFLIRKCLVLILQINS